MTDTDAEDHAPLATAVQWHSRRRRIRSSIAAAKLPTPGGTTFTTPWQSRSGSAVSITSAPTGDERALDVPRRRDRRINQDEIHQMTPFVLGSLVRQFLSRSTNATADSEIASAAW